MISQINDVLLFLKYFLVWINPSITHTINLFEFSAVALGLIGIVVAWNGVVHARSKRDNLILSDRNGILLLIANENLRIERERRAKLAWVLVAGFVAVLVPSNPDVELRWAGSLISIALIMLIFRLTRCAFIALQYRQRFDEYIQELERESQVAALAGGRRKEDKENGA